MLIEISCDKFKSDGEPRPPITFHTGLNTVLGGMKGDNSIGKSSLLQIIDFAFGGNTYVESAAVTELGPHTINFAFKFNGKIEHYSRSTSQKDSVGICNSSYEVVGEPITIKDFTTHLKSSYEMNLDDITFRQAVSLYFRMQGKTNLTTSRPLSNVPMERINTTILTLEKLFNAYQKIKEYEQALKKADEKKKAYNKVRTLELIPNATTSQKQRDDNEQAIENLKQDLSALTLEVDSDISVVNLDKLSETSGLNGMIANYKRKLSGLKSQLTVVQQNVKESSPLANSDLKEFVTFFPDSDLKLISEIQAFHHKIVGVLDSELTAEAQKLQNVIFFVEQEIKSLEDKIRDLGMPINIPKPFIDKMSDITSQINALEKQNESFDIVKKLRDEYNQANKELESMQASQLEDIESKINYTLHEMNRSFPDNKFAPVIKFETDSKYRFFTPEDDGTGTAWKALILFDLAILNLTVLPAIAHDSLLLKNIEDDSIDAIIKLYAQNQKQIFLAFDKEGAYSEETQKILNDTAVLHLSKGGNELFGYQWGREK